MSQNFDLRLANTTLKQPLEVFMPPPSTSQIYLEEEDDDSSSNSNQPLKILLIILILISFILISAFLIVFLLTHEGDEGMTNELEGRNLYVEATGSLPMDFSRANGTTEWNFDHKKHENFKFFEEFKCGVSGNEISDRIEGGKIARIMEFPWAVAMFVKNNENLEFFCGGSLIHEKLISTAAHCITAATGREVIVRLGEFNMSSTTDCEYFNGTSYNCADPVQDFSSANFTAIIHPGYDSSTLLNDIALIQLKYPADLSRNNIKAICLPFEFKEIPNRMVVTGFGESGKIHSVKTGVKVLEQGFVGHIPNKNCTEYYEGFKDAKFLTENQFCAAGKKENTYIDTCRGDSGGAIQMLKIVEHKVSKRELEYDDDEVDQTTLPVPPKFFYQFGIVSFGEKKTCGEGSRPGVYTAIYPYMKWILDNYD